MYDYGYFVHQQCSQLSFNFRLQVFSHERDGVEGGGDLEGFKGIITKHQGQTLVFRENEDDEGGEFDFGEGDLDGYRQAGGRSQRLGGCEGRSGGEECI